MTKAIRCAACTKRIRPHHPYIGVEELGTGRDLSREIAHGESVERELDAFIERRPEQRAKTEGERAVEDLWREAERKEAKRRREENRGGWLAYYRRLERGYLERAAECAGRADELEGTGPAVDQFDPLKKGRHAAERRT